jgi:hypothetical protein
MTLLITTPSIFYEVVTTYIKLTYEILDLNSGHDIWFNNFDILSVELKFIRRLFIFQLKEELCLEK